MKDQVSTLNDSIPQIELIMDNRLEWTVSTESTSRGWFDVSTRDGSINTGKAFAFTTAMDVSGWGNQGLTFFPMQAGVQEGYTYRYLVDESLRVIDMISDSPLDIARYVRSNALAFPNLTVPALLEGTQDGSPNTRVFPPLGWENILYGNDRLFQHNNNLQGTLVLPVSTNDFGSMNPTASDKLYITRIIICDVGNTAQTGGLAYIPPTRFIIKGMLKSETDLSYIFRLKDSFKTAQTDVGYNEL